MFEFVALAGMVVILKIVHFHQGRCISSAYRRKMTLLFYIHRLFLGVVGSPSLALQLIKDKIDKTALIYVGFYGVLDV